MPGFRVLAPAAGEAGLVVAAAAAAAVHAAAAVLAVVVAQLVRPVPREQAGALAARVARVVPRRRRPRELTRKMSSPRRRQEAPWCQSTRSWRRADSLPGSCSKSAQKRLTGVAGGRALKSALLVSHAVS
jgi:hypothetical protein